MRVTKKSTGSLLVEPFSLLLLLLRILLRNDSMRQQRRRRWRRPWAQQEVMNPNGSLLLRTLLQTYSMQRRQRRRRPWVRQEVMNSNGSLLLPNPRHHPILLQSGLSDDRTSQHSKTHAMTMRTLLLRKMKNSVCGTDVGTLLLTTEREKLLPAVSMQRVVTQQKKERDCGRVGRAQQQKQPQPRERSILRS